MENKPNFFIAGSTGSGKDTIANYLKTYFEYNKFRIADTIKRIITEKRNISFDELEELKRNNPEIRDEHTDTGDWLGATTNLNRIKLLINGKALDWVNLDKDGNYVICDVRSKGESLEILNNEIFNGYGIFLSRTTSEYGKETHWTQQNMFTNGDINEIISLHGEKCIIILNGGSFNLEEMKSNCNENNGTPIFVEFEHEPNETELIDVLDAIITNLIELENE